VISARSNRWSTCEPSRFTSPAGSTTVGRINDGVTVRKDSSFCLADSACRRDYRMTRTMDKKVELYGISRQTIKQSWLATKTSYSGVRAHKK
jgi:hypothetical protein